ncbi:hypothetical protein AVEN_200572-1 [Araneus ventricosus]|uniref:Uncharacterized protein n=1 Tax=Araneus ventricosus TaxID=182803 RepID=A0A4Y2W075_ARAVE|nr:hypothetical protein AVEN_200572-1 [Araneus ventricosus]
MLKICLLVSQDVSQYVARSLMARKRVLLEAKPMNPTLVTKGSFQKMPELWYYLCLVRKYGEPSREYVKSHPDGKGINTENSSSESVGVLSAVPASNLIYAEC